MLQILPCPRYRCCGRGWYCLPAPLRGAALRARLLYAAEDALHIVRQRLEGICAASGVALVDLDIQVITAPTLPLDLEADRKSLEATVARLRPRLLELEPPRAPWCRRSRGGSISAQNELYEVSTSLIRALLAQIR
jgi:hypothetical protein